MLSDHPNHPKLVELRKLLAEAGFTDEEERSYEDPFDEMAPYYSLGVSRNSIVVEVAIPLGYDELPKDLQPYADTPESVHRSMHKGSSNKLSWSGTNFQQAFHAYLVDKASELPEWKELDEAVKTVTTMEQLDALSYKRQAIIDKMIEDDMRLRVWKWHLDNCYF